MTAEKMTQLADDIEVQSFPIMLDLMLDESDRKLIIAALRASAGAREALEPAGKQARFKKDISPWFAVFNWHNDPENFEYRTVYALQSEPVRRTTQPIQRDKEPS